MRYIVAVEHKPTGQRIVFGSDCVVRLNFANAKEFKAAQLKARAEAGHARMRIIAARAKYIAEHPVVLEVAAKLADPVHAKNNFVRHILSKLDQYGYLTERQLACLMPSLQRDVEYAAKRAAKDALPKGTVVAGRQEFDCTVVSYKWVESDFGDHWKMLLERADNTRVWVTVPSALGEPAKGQKLRIRCHVEPSRDDAAFGFGKRPHLVKNYDEKPVSATTG